MTKTLCHITMLSHLSAIFGGTTTQNIWFEVNVNQIKLCTTCIIFLQDNHVENIGQSNVKCMLPFDHSKIAEAFSRRVGWIGSWSFKTHTHIWIYYFRIWASLSRLTRVSDAEKNEQNWEMYRMICFVCVNWPISLVNLKLLKLCL